MGSSRLNRKKLLTILLIVLLLATCVAVFILTRAPSSPAVTSPEIPPVAVEPEPEIEPPSIGKLAYVEYNSNWAYDLKGDLVIIDPVIGTREILVSSAVEKVFSWSPDNKYIAFNRIDKEGDKFLVKLSLVEVASKTVTKTDYQNVVGVDWRSDSTVLLTLGSSLRLVDVPSLNIIATNEQVSNIFSAAYNLGAKRAFAFTPPEDSKPYILDVELNKREMFSDLGLPVDVVLGTWSGDDKLIYVASNQIFSYDSSKKENVAVSNLPFTIADFSNVIWMDAAANGLFYIQWSYSAASNTYTTTLHKVNLEDGVGDVLFGETFGNSGQELFAVNPSGKYFVWYNVVSGKSTSFIENLETRERESFCSPQACNTPVWSN